MKSYMIALSALLIGGAVPAFSAEQDAAALEQIEQCEAGADNAATAESAGQDSEQADLSAANPHGQPLWHCTGYPNWGGHGHGHDAFDYYYQTAYYRALNSCQRYHGWGACHVHCHQDWH